MDVSEYFTPKPQNKRVRDDQETSTRQQHLRRRVAIGDDDGSIMVEREENEVTVATANDTGARLVSCIRCISHRSSR